MVPQAQLIYLKMEYRQAYLSMGLMDLSIIYTAIKKLAYLATRLQAHMVTITF